MFSRKDIRPDQTRLLTRMGFLPVSIDHRLCPETTLAEGPMVDVCDALHWARFTLPSMDLGDSSLRPDGGRVVVVGWSSGGQLAMSLAWTAPQRGLEPPAAILAFYPPTDYEDECKSYVVDEYRSRSEDGCVADACLQGGRIRFNLSARKISVKIMISWRLYSPCQ